MPRPVGLRRKDRQFEGKNKVFVVENRFSTGFLYTKVCGSTGAKPL